MVRLRYLEGISEGSLIFFEGSVGELRRVKVQSFCKGSLKFAEVR